MPEFDIEAAQALCDAATPGPWEIGDEAGGYRIRASDIYVAGNWDWEDGGIIAKSDAELIAAIPDVLPTALDEIRRLRARAEKAESAIADVLAIARDGSWPEDGGGIAVLDAEQVRDAALGKPTSEDTDA